MNPLYIYGVSGVGKTHILRAVQHAAKRRIPTKSAIYTTARDLCDEMVRSIRRGETCGMRENRYQADIVMIDDLQYLADKNATQVELSRLILSVCARNRQVILMSDRPLEEFPVLNNQMNTRLWPPPREINIKAPNRGLRKKLIRKKSKAMGLKIDDETFSGILESASNSLQIDRLLNELELRRSMERNSLSKKGKDKNHTS